MKKSPVAFFVVFGAMILFCAGCATTPQESDREPAASLTAKSETQMQPGEPESGTQFLERDLLRYRGEFFSAAGECSVCHQKMRDENGVDVSIDTHWRASMMANAARDPYYLASVRSERDQHPDLGNDIETKCATCHLPMGVTTAIFTNQPAHMLEDGLLDDENENFTLSIDGVSCTLCHQIAGEQLGESQSFSGGFVIDAETPSGERNLYGPYPVDENMTTIMQSASGFIPQEGKHIESAALCSVCHTLYTTTITPDGEATGSSFPEQTPFLEWQSSDYVEVTSCQGCHMPVAEGSVTTSIIGGVPRSPFFQHEFAGGNRYMLEILAANAEQIGVSAEEEHFKQKIIQVEDMLQNRTATLAASAQLQDEQLEILVAVENMAGHKFPSGFPSRRVWLHVTVSDEEGNFLFESGAWQDDGSIVGNANDENGLEYEPHFDVIVSPDQVQIYEAIFVDSNRQVTTGLMLASEYIKNNRLLPAGFAKDQVSGDIAVVGDAATDENFIGGGDEIVYAIPVGRGQTSFTIEVELLYQTIGYRWEQKFADSSSPEGMAFQTYQEKVANIPVLVDSVLLTVP